MIRARERVLEGDRLAIRSTRVLSPDGVAPAIVVIDGSRIGEVIRTPPTTGPAKAPTTMPTHGGDVEVVDVGSAIVAPGLVDTQINGGFGIDLVESPDRVWELAESLARSGVTAFVPTLSSHDPLLGSVEELGRTLATAPDDDVVRARPLGVHLEGPFLAPGRRGAHPAAAIRPVDHELLRRWLALAPVVMMTIAPELDGAEELAVELRRRGVVVAAGHTEADGAVLRRLASAGVLTHVTHCWNAMDGIHHRRPGTVGAALVDDRLTLGLVCDGHHVVPEILDLTWRAAGHRRIVVVSDAVADARPGAVDGAADDERGVLTGGLALLDEGLRVLRRATGAPPVELLATATRNAVRLLRRPGTPGAARQLDRDRWFTGQLISGGPADLVVFDDDLRPVATMVGGSWAVEPPTA